MGSFKSRLLIQAWKCVKNALVYIAHNDTCCTHIVSIRTNDTCYTYIADNYKKKFNDTCYNL